jgi:uncharacterized repeat protein (TIGR03803 family)
LICILIALCAAAAIASTAQTFTSLASFDSAHGANPYAPLMQATDGNFYGTTFQGGANNQGTVFKMTPAGALTSLYSFSGTADGRSPQAGLVQGTDGNFYGTTVGGGSANYGTIFNITPIGTLTTLHMFTAAEGWYPYAGLVQSTDGNFYGSTLGGGTFGYGTVFQFSSGATLAALYHFCGQSGCADGANPTAGLVQASDGNFYGTTYQGGANFLGTVYKITPGGTLTTLHTFDGTDGQYPNAGLVQASDGNFYGTTYQGGTNAVGTVYKINPRGTLTTLHSFNLADGADPEAGLVQANDGNFYGTASGGGANGQGTIFKMSPSGTVTVLHDFNGTDGAAPFAGLVQATDGRFYGTTSQGGANLLGTVFSLDVGLVTLSVTTTGSGTVISGEGRIRCGSACSSGYVRGTSQGLTAMPGIGSTLTSWSGCTSTQGNVCTVAIDGTRTVAAAFASSPIMFGSLTFSPSPVRHGNIAVGTLTLGAAAPSGGVTIGLRSSQRGIVSVPSIIYIPGGSRSFKFGALVIGVRPTSVTVTATDGTTSTGGIVRVTP